MLELRLNNETVNLPEGATVSYELVSPYWLYDTIPASSIKPPNLPFTGTNQRIFRYWHEPMTAGAAPEYSWQMYFGGEFLRAGFYRLQEASTRGFSGNFTEKLNEFFGDYQTRNLQEIDFGTLALPSVLTPSVSDMGLEAVVFPTILNPDYYGSNAAAAGYNGKVNAYAAGAYDSSQPLVPMLTLKYVFLKIAILTGVTIVANFLANAAWANLILINTRALDGASSVNIAKHLPEMTVIQFFLELRKIPNLAYKFDPINRKLTIDFWDDYLPAPTTVDWSQKAIVGETKLPEQNTRIQLGYELDGGDALMKDKPTAVQDYTTPLFAGQTYSGVAKITSKFSTCITDTSTGLLSMKQPGVTASYNQLTNRFAPRLAFWAGLVGGVPMAAPKLGGYSLYWNGSDGLAAMCWKNTEALRVRQFYLKKQIQLNEVDLAQLDFTKKVHINGTDYLLVSLSTELPLRKAADCLLVGGV